MLKANIRSLNKDVDSFKDFINTSPIQFGIIGLVETWLKDKPRNRIILILILLNLQELLQKQLFNWQHIYQLKIQTNIWNHYYHDYWSERYL